MEKKLKDAAVVLEIEGVDKAFPGVLALSNINLQLNYGEVHAVCGENGAGKSTLMKIIAGVYQPDKGKILLNGQNIKIDNPNDAYSRGIAIIFQETSLFPDLTVLENMFMGHEIKRNLFPFVKVLDYPSMRKKSNEIFARMDMTIDLDTCVSEFGVATRQMVEIAKALTYNSKILILDEPTSALTHREVTTLFEIIGKLKAEGVSMLYISHRLDEIFDIADRVSVFRDGKYIVTENVDKVSPDQLISWMVGRKLTDLYPKEEVEIGEIVFEVKNLSQDGFLKNIDFVLKKGEILGLSGLAGAGRTELALAISGLTHPDTGEIFLNGSKLKLKNYRQALANGIVYVSEDRQKYGLLIPMTIEENITLSLLSSISNSIGLIDFKEEARITNKYIDHLSIKAQGGSTVIETLSGGNQQKVSVAKALASKPQILILDEPTRGVDVGAKSEIHKIISNLAKQGKSIILISSDLPEILGMSDRVVVMKNGSKMGELMRSELSQEKILQMSL